MKGDLNLERRIGMSDVLTKIALIEQKSGFIDEKLQLIINDMEEVKSVLNNRENLKKKDLEIHATQDRWMFGLVITLLICIFTKLIIS